jgi:hypothetical protein
MTGNNVSKRKREKKRQRRQTMQPATNEKKQGKWPAYEWLSIKLFSIISEN